MKRLLVAVVTAMALLSAPVLAAPVNATAHMAAVPNNSWTGCYIGGNVGGGWSHVDFTDHLGNPEGGHSATGWVGGGQIGCDYQFASTWVIGIQGMWDGSNVKGSNASARFPANTLESNVRSFGTVTGVLGYLVNPAVKLYGKAGYGWVNDHFDCPTGSCAGTNASGTLSGFDFGGGVAWMLAQNWNIFVEYDHMWLGDKSVSFSGAFNEGIHQNFDKVLVGVNFRFIPWGAGP